MIFQCHPSKLEGEVDIPASKSHTIRAVVLAALADGTSVIHNPLLSADAMSAADAVTAFGAEVERDIGTWTISGVGADIKPRRSEIDVGNSGTTLRILMSVAALMPEDCEIRFTGDEQIQTRPAGPLLKALNDLGANAVSERGNDCPPYRIRGRLRGGITAVEAKSSQYLTSLLIACPLAAGNTVIDLPLLYEAQYVEMTLWWLRNQNIRFEHDNLRHFEIPGGQAYTPFERRIPGDFSSATFFFGAGAISENDVTCRGLDITDTQGDKAVLDYLRAMGADVDVSDDAGIRVRGGSLRGIEVDMNDTPDALPVMAVLGCFAEGQTRLCNVAQARMKETDRITVMAQELRKMGAQIDEHKDGMTIHQSNLRGATVRGHGDHRVVMALALAGMSCPGETIIDTAEAAGITFPGFKTLMTELGGDIVSVE